MSMLLHTTSSAVNAMPNLTDILLIPLASAYAQTSNMYHRLNSPLIMPPARFLARPDPYMAFEAKPVAWLNLSHREKASVFVIVRTSAMTT
jgi:hypothetical protein